MPQETNKKNPNAKFLRRSFWFFLSVLISFLSFNYGYVKGFDRVRTGLFNSVFNLNKYYLSPTLEKDSLIRTIPITYTRYGTLFELDLQVIYPYSWVLITKQQDNAVGGVLADEVIYEIRDAESKILLRIEPLNVDFSRAVMSASTNVTMTQQILDNEIVIYDVPEEGEELFITVYREPESDTKVSYVQGIKSKMNPSEELRKLDNFIIFNHNPKEESNILLKAEITLEFEESLSREEKEEFLKRVDSIVASLRLL